MIEGAFRICLLSQLNIDRYSRAKAQDKKKKIYVVHCQKF